MHVVDLGVGDCNLVLNIFVYNRSLQELFKALANFALGRCCDRGQRLGRVLKFEEILQLDSVLCELCRGQSEIDVWDVSSGRNAKVEAEVQQQPQPPH